MFKPLTTSTGSSPDLSRRSLIKLLLALGVCNPLLSGLVNSASQQRQLKNIPSSSEKLPVIGLGTSRTFDILNQPEKLDALSEVMQLFFNQQGSLIDSSPMYGEAENVIGKLLKNIQQPHPLFAASKVWTDGKQAGIEQIQTSRNLWGIKRFDLMQIHNLRDWKTHINTLNNMKAEGQIRYTGITTSHGRFHNELISLLQHQTFDFIQLSYNILDREVENRLLPLAIDKGIAVITNRPYQRGELFRKVKSKPLPDWASDINVNSWGQFFLKFIVSHPAVTCAIPATTKAKHLLDNMGAQFGPLADEKMRNEMIHYISRLS